VVPHSTADGKEIRARINQRFRVVRRDAANRNAWHFCDKRPFLYGVEFGDMIDLFGGRWEERAKGDIIRASLCCFHR
jgi:hypothetical protein